MKLLESAKDLKTSCYIYFLIGNESLTYITNVAYYQLLDIHTIKDDITRWDIWWFGRFERCSEDFPALSKVVGCR